MTTRQTSILISLLDQLHPAALHNLPACAPDVRKELAETIVLVNLVSLHVDVTLIVKH